ncbi:hypothetical protein D3C72_1920650 [compost metagenome]
MKLDLIPGVGSHLDPDHDLTAFGELGGVVAEVDQYLTQPQRIAYQCGRQVGRSGEQ